MELEDFGDQILDDDTQIRDNDDSFGGSYFPDVVLDSRKVVNVIIAKNLNMAPEAIQVQALEVCWFDLPPLTFRVRHANGTRSSFAEDGYMLEQPFTPPQTYLS